jgi:NADH:ubiquinone reductase (non-electrogenic)
MKKNILILGSGFGSFSCLRILDPKYYDISVVSPRNHFLFTPLLPSTTVGTIEFRSIIEPLRNHKHIKFYQSRCSSIDFEKNKINCKDSDTDNEFDIPFDYLIIAVGEVTRTFNIPGVKEYAYFLKEVTDARKIRIKVIDCFENASLPSLTPEMKKKYLHFFVCGGGPTGVEFAAELNDFIEEDVKKKYPELSPLIELVLIEAGQKILSGFDEKLSQYTTKIFKRQNIKIKTGSNITEVTDKYIFINDGTKHEYGLLVWATGNAPNPLVSSLNIPKSNRGKILVDDFFKVKGYNNVYALGDCSEHDTLPFPVTAQVAQQEGKYLAKSFNKLAQGKQVKPFSFRNFGMLAYIGNRKALADTPQYKSSGFMTFLFWRSAYLTKLVSMKNKILVLFDWTKNVLFGRDVSNF